MGLCKLTTGETLAIQMQISLFAVSCTMNLSQSCLRERNLHKAFLLLTQESWVLELYILLVREVQAELHGDRKRSLGI